MHWIGGSCALACTVAALALPGAGWAAQATLMTGSGPTPPVPTLHVWPLLPYAPVALSEPMATTVIVDAAQRTAMVRDDLLLLSSGGCAATMPLREARCSAPAPMLSFVSGGAQADRLTVWGPVTAVSAGGGDDRVDARSSSAEVSCGPGTDTVQAGAATRVRPDCELVVRG